MKIKFLWVDETKLDFAKKAQSLYLERLKHYTKVEISAVKGAKLTSKINEQQIIDEEGQRLLSKIQPNDFVVVLDNRGQEVSSEILAETIQKWQNQSVKQAVLIIGGPLGLSDAIRQRAQWVWSLSKLTLPHDLARIVMMEQLYRSFTILRGEKYHK